MVYERSIFGLLDGGEDDEHCGVGFMEILRIFAKQDEFLFGTERFDKNYYTIFPNGGEAGSDTTPK